MSLPARFLTVRPLLMSAASALPLMTWLRRTVLTVASSGAEGRLPMKRARAAAVGAKTVRSELPLRAPTRSARCTSERSVFSPWPRRPAARVAARAPLAVAAPAAVAAGPGGGQGGQGAEEGEG